MNRKIYSQPRDIHFQTEESKYELLQKLCKKKKLKISQQLNILIDEYLKQNATN